MATDDERREVARRLREHSGARLFTGEDVERLIGIELSGFRPKDADNSYNRLADLIEPSDHIGDSDKMVDREALLDMEDEMFESATGLALISELEEDADLKDLQTTMAKVLFGYARRIREACNVVDAG